MSTYMDEARRLRPLIEQAVQSLSDADALTAVTLYPRWADLVALGSAEAPAGYRFQGPDGQLYACRNENPTFQADWVPGIDTSALYLRVAEQYEGTTADDPITAARGMEYVYGKYYLDPEDGVTYICRREGEADGGTIALAYLPHELVGHYFEIA